MGSTARACLRRGQRRPPVSRRLLDVGQAQPGRPVVGVRSHPRPQLLDRAVGGAVGRDVDRQPRPLVGVQGVVGNGAVVAVEVVPFAPAAASARRRCSHPPTAAPGPRAAPPPAATGRAPAGRAAWPRRRRCRRRSPAAPPRCAHRRPAVAARPPRSTASLFAGAGPAAPRPAGRAPAAGGRTAPGRRLPLRRAASRRRARSRPRAAAAASADHGRHREQHDQPPAAAGNMFAGWLVHSGKGMEFGSIPRYNSEGHSCPRRACACGVSVKG